jgi:hypothetical protein
MTDYGKKERELKDRLTKLASERKKLLSEEAKLVHEEKKLPEDQATLKKEIEQADPLALGFEAWERLKKKEYFYLDRDARLQESLYHCRGLLREIGSEINNVRAALLRLRLSSLGADWEPEREKFLRLLAAWKLQTGQANALAVFDYLFRLNDPEVRKEFNSIYEQMASEMASLVDG